MATGGKVIILFSSSLMKNPNKLERLNLASS
jgi:hypothetical protein